jgi:ribonuclease J
VLSEVGLVTVVVVIAADTGKLITGPELYSVGVTFDEVEPELLEGARIALEERLAEIDPKTVTQWEDAREDIRLAVRRYINRLLGRKPLIQTIILQA